MGWRFRDVVRDLEKDGMVSVLEREREHNDLLFPCR